MTSVNSQQKSQGCKREKGMERKAASLPLLLRSRQIRGRGAEAPYFMHLC